jgi:Domain of unknown function (DUF4157)
VRVHADREAATAARAVQARAYTISRDIVFDTGEYAPGTEAGKRLLAHELVHVVQQSARGPAAPRLRRFTSAEHKSLGDQAATGMRSDINMGTDAVPDYLTFGDVVALAADYFGSLEEMRSLASTEAGRAKLRWVYWWALGKAQGKPEPPLGRYCQTGDQGSLLQTRQPECFALQRRRHRRRYIQGPTHQGTSGRLSMKWTWGFFNQRMYNAVDAAVKEDIVKQLKEKAAEQTDQNVRDALADFSSLLEILGISALEQAVGEPAKQKRYPLPGMYGYQPPGPDD